MQLYTKIFIGLGLGVAIGFVANAGDIEWLRDALVIVRPLGTAFIRLITMIVIPLVVASLLVGTASLGDVRKLGRIGGKTLTYYMVTTAIAVTIGLLLSNIVRPGRDIEATTRDELAAQFGGEAQDMIATAEAAPSVSETLINIIPRNPFQAAAEFQLLPLIFFTVIFGAGVSVIAADKRKSVLSFFEGVNEAAMVIIRWVMKLAPYAVFVLIAAVVAQFGADLLKSLLIYALVVVGGLALHAFGSLAVILRFAAKVNPLRFYRQIVNVPVLAFSTSSSNATLPLTIETAKKKVGISNEVSSFVLPLGATINMDGTALYQAVAVMFIAQIYGVPMGIFEQLVIVLTATLASIGAAGVPSAGIITLIIVLNAVGLGERVEAGIALILGVDRILDMLRTSVNVTGDLTCSTFIARTEGEVINLEPVGQPVPAD